MPLIAKESQSISPAWPCSAAAAAIFWAASRPRTTPLELNPVRSLNPFEALPLRPGAALAPSAAPSPNRPARFARRASSTASISPESPFRPRLAPFPFPFPFFPFSFPFFPFRPWTNAAPRSRGVSVPGSIGGEGTRACVQPSGCFRALTLGLGSAGEGSAPNVRMGPNSKVLDPVGFQPRGWTVVLTPPGAGAGASGANCQGWAACGGGGGGGCRSVASE